MAMVILLTTVDLSVFATESTVSGNEQTLVEEVTDKETENQENETTVSGDEVEQEENVSVQDPEEVVSANTMENMTTATTASGQCGDNLIWTLTEGILTISGTGAMWDYDNTKEGQTEAPWISYKDQLTQLVLTEGITYIGDNAFKGCNKLKGELVIPNTVTAIGNGAFASCFYFTTLKLSNNLKSIGDFAFSTCFGLSGELIIPEGVEEIGCEAFANCTGFTGNLTIPSSVTLIDMCAFYYCSNIGNTVYIKSNDILLSDLVFSGTGINTIYGFKGTDAEEYATRNGLEFIIVYRRNEEFVITVLDEDFNTPISGVQITVEGNVYETRTDGSIKVGCINSYTDILLVKKGYETKSVTMQLSSKARNVIFLKKGIGFNVRMPELYAEVPLEHEINILGYDLKWLDLDYKVDIKLAKWTTKDGIKRSIPIKIIPDHNTRTLKVMFGVADKDEEGKVNTYEYKKMKDLCKSILNNPSTKENKDKLFKYLREHGEFDKNKNNGVLGVEIKTHVLGYFEINYDTGELIEGGAVVGISGEGDITWRPTFAAKVLYFKVNLTISAEGKLVLEFENEDISFLAELELEQILGIAGGAGTENCHVEIGFEGGLKEIIDIPFYRAEEDFKVSLNGKIYGEVKCLLGQGTADKELFDIQIYPRAKETVRNIYNTSENIFNINRMTMSERNYTSLADIYDMSQEIVNNSVYSEGKPKIVSLKNGNKLAVWITDNRTKSDENRTTLVYSFNEGSGWSNPRAVCETGRGDFYPSLSVEENKVHLIWTNMGKEFSVGTEVAEMLAHTNIYYALFENGSFSKPFLLTEADNDTMELDAKVTSNGEQIAVAWMENSENDPFYTSGTSRIGLKICENGMWKETTYVLDGLIGVTDMDLAYIDDVLSIAYVKDTDGDINTKEDRDVFLYRKGIVIRLTNDQKTDSNLVFSEKGQLYWLSDGEIVKVSKDNVHEVKTSGITGLYEFKVIENSAGNAIVFPIKEGFRSELYVSREKDGTLERPIQITECGQRIEDYALLYNDDGSISGIVYETEVLEESEDSLYGNTVMKICNVLESSEVEVTYLFVDENEVIPNSELPVTIHFLNNSSYDMNEVAVKIKKNNTLIVDTIISCAVKAGEEGEIICDYPLDNVIAMHDITVEIYPTNFVDHKTENNSATKRIALGDILVEDVTVTTTEQGKELNGKIINKGYGLIEGITFKILEGSFEGEEIYVSSYDSLAAGEEVDFSYKIPDSMLEFTHENEVKYFYLVCEAQTDEANYGNNTEVQGVFPIKVTGLEVKQEMLTLCVNEAIALNAYVEPANAINQNIYYTTDNSEIAVVTEDGVVIATGTGKTTVSAISADGGFAKNVAVDVKENTTVLYHLNEKKILLDKGEKTNLFLLNEKDTKVPEEVADAIIWKSSNEEVATVSEDGHIKAVSAGTAQISAVIEDVFYGVCVVEIIDKELQGIIFEEGKCELIEGNTKKLDVFYVPEDTITDKELTFKSDNEAVATVNRNGEITAVSEGTATITATTKNGISAQCQIVVAGFVKSTVSFDTLLGEEPTQIVDVLYGSTVTLPPVPMRSGYEFLGWNTKADGSGNLFTEETVILEDITVYAMWKNQVVEQLAPAVPNIATGSVVEKTTEIILSCEIEGAQIYYTLDETEPTIDSTLYTAPIVVTEATTIKAIAVKEGYNNSEVAVFRYTIAKGENVTFTVNFNSNGGSEVLAQIVEENQTVVEPEVPTRKGYIFKGWYLSDELYDFETPVTTNITLEARWEIDESQKQGDILPEDIPEDGNIPSGIWSAGITDKTYTGSNITQSFRVYDNTKLLKEKTDYTLSYKNNKNAYTYLDEDYAAFEENFKATGKKVKTGTFDPAKAPQLTIKMKGNYSGSKTIYFKIEPADISEAGFEAADLTVTYNGKKQTPQPALTWNGKKLKYGTDFHVPEYDNAKNDKKAFTQPQEDGYPLTVTGKKNFTGEIPITLTISDHGKQIAMNKVTVKGLVSKPWTGDQIIQSGFKVNYGNDVLAEESGDYIISWGTNKAVGTGSVTFTGTGEDTDGDGLSYIGTKTVTFKITGTAMSKVTVAGVEKSYPFTGTAIKPEASLSYKANKNTQEIPLTEGIHYTVDYQKNVDKGTATIVFTGLESGGYTGTKKQTFKITVAGVSDILDGDVVTEQIQVSFPDTANVKDGVYIASHMKGGAKPEVTVTAGDMTLELNKDYTISYANNKKPALSTDKNAPSLTIKGKGNFSGSKKVTFTIEPKPLTSENGIRVVANDKIANGKKNGYRQSFKVYDADGKALGSADYDAANVVYTLIKTRKEDGTMKEENTVLDKNSIVPANSVIRITVTGKGNYAKDGEACEAYGTYRILENSHDISKATIQIQDQDYTGRPVLITEQSQFKPDKVYIKIGKETKELILGEDIEVVPDSYVKHVNKGTAKVKFRGINDFGGTKTVNYKIGARSINEFWEEMQERIKNLFN